MLIKKQNYVYRIKFYKDGIEILSFPLRYILKCNYNYKFFKNNSGGAVTLKEVSLSVMNKLVNIYNNIYTMAMYCKAKSIINVLIKKRNEIILLHDTFLNEFGIFLTEYQDVILRSDYIEEYKYNE